MKISRVKNTLYVGKAMVELNLAEKVKQIGVETASLAKNGFLKEAGPLMRIINDSKADAASRREAQSKLAYILVDAERKSGIKYDALRDRYVNRKLDAPAENRTPV